MVKKVGLVLALVLALAFIGNSVFASGPGPSNTETAIAVVSENVQMEVQNPFQVTIKRMDTTLEFEDGKVTPIYPGQTISNGEITIANVSPIEQAAILYARPIRVATNSSVAWPSLEVVVTSGGTTYYPWQQIVITPGVSVTLGVEVKVTYGGLVSSPFNGVEVVVTAMSPQNRPSGCDPQGCG